MFGERSKGITPAGCSAWAWHTSYNQQVAAIIITTVIIMPTSRVAEGARLQAGFRSRPPTPWPQLPVLDKEGQAGGSSGLPTNSGPSLLRYLGKGA